MVFLRLLVAQGGKLELEKVVRPAEPDTRRGFHGLAYIHNLPTLGQRGEYDRRDVRIVQDLLRVESIEAADAAKKHFTTWALVVRSLVEFVALQAVIHVIIAEGLCLGIESRQSQVGAKPQLAFIVLQNAIDRIVHQAVFLSVLNKGLSRAIELVETGTPGCHP